MCSSGRKKQQHTISHTTSAEPTLTLERTLQLHNDLVVRATDRHGETTHIATALALETIRTLTSKEIGLLAASTHAISTRQKHIILILSLEASDQLQNLNTLFNIQSANYI